MKKKKSFAILYPFICILSAVLPLFSAPVMAEEKRSLLPDSIPVAVCRKFHIQGLAMDKAHRYFYLSYTTQLVKFDLKGNVIGSVSGLLGHLGCIAYNAQDGKVYGSLEYKNDEIGRNIIDKSIGHRESATQFYIAVFDVDKINRIGMDGLRDSIMRTICLPTVKKLYEGTTTVNDVSHKHIYGCSGIDGITFGPRFGKRVGRTYLTVALGIYGDVQRTDNDYQVLLQYPWPSAMRYARPLNLNHMHTSGPKKPVATYFAYTGNTTYGVQNLEYDSYSDQWFMAVYKGTKKQFPNYQLFAIDNRVSPHRGILIGHGGERGRIVQLSRKGMHDTASGIYGWNFPYGSMGMQAMGDGEFYFLHPTNKQGYSGWLELYRYEPDTLKPFIKAKL